MNFKVFRPLTAALADKHMAINHGSKQERDANLGIEATAQNAALTDEVTALTILTRRMTASVLLIKAIGGGWDVSQIPHV